MTLYCALCWFHPEQAGQEAVTVINGQAEGGDFAQALAVMNRELREQGQ